ncbi:MAG: DUF374 domain-containing protein [Thermoanaerobaculia bacterium]
MPESSTPVTSRSRPVKRLLMRWCVPPLALGMIRLLDWTWRHQEFHRERFESCLADSRSLVVGFLHGRTFALLRTMSRPHNGRWVSMCSKSLDGDAMAEIEKRLGFQVVRGSSGTDGLQAIVDMIKRVRHDPGLGSCLAVDGSRGPRGRVQGGIISLAQRTGGVLMPITASANPGYIFSRSWDRTLLPLPFAKVVIVYGEAMEVPVRPTSEQFAALVREFESRMLALQAEADSYSGRSDPLFSEKTP